MDICSVFWNYYVFSKMGHQHIVHVTHALSPCCRETPEFIPPEMWPPNSPDLNPVDYSICMGYASREGLPLVDP